MLNTLNNLLISELRDLYSAEKQVLEGIHELKSSASSKKLKRFFSEMKGAITENIDDLTSVFGILSADSLGRFSESMESLLEDCQKHLMEVAVPTVKDVLLVNYSLRLTHYLISGYVIALSMAREVETEEVQTILDDCLSREQAMEASLRKIANGGIFTRGLTGKAPV